jgi:hypothetical protein
VREVIRSRVYQEVTEHNARQTQRRNRLDAPGMVARLLGAGRPARERLDWEEHFTLALQAFQANRFLLLVDDRQVTDLTEVVELRHDSTITFLKLVPLVGG